MLVKSARYNVTWLRSEGNDTCHGRIQVKSKNVVGVNVIGMYIAYMYTGFDKYMCHIFKEISND